jgi:TolB-like protein
MRTLAAIATAAALTVSGVAFGQYPPAPAAPSAYPPSAQATQPAAAQPVGQAVPQSAPPRVQVFPFEPVGSVDGSEWIGKGMQASLQSDVSHTGAMLLMAPGAPAPGFDPVAIARSNGATLAVTGTYQVENGSVRADGHLIDTATGRQVGGFSGKAPINSVFALEDAVGEQLRRLLPADRPVAASPPPQQAPGAVNADGTPVVTYAPPQATVVEPSTTVTYAPAYTEVAPAATYDYGDAAYGYPYGGYYGVYDPFVFGFYGGVGYYGGYGYRGGYGRHYSPTFHSGGYGGRGYSVGAGGGRSYSAGGGLHAAVGGGGGFHGGGGGGHR